MHLHRRLDRLGLATQDVDSQPVFAKSPINQQHTANRPGLGSSLVHAEKTLKCAQKISLHSRKNRRFRLGSTKALERFAHHYDKPRRQAAALKRV